VYCGPVQRFTDDAELRAVLARQSSAQRLVNDTEMFLRPFLFRWRRFAKNARRDQAFNLHGVTWESRTPIDDGKLVCSTPDARISAISG
jgi:hypothetical protein